MFLTTRICLLPVLPYVFSLSQWKPWTTNTTLHMLQNFVVHLQWLLWTEAQAFQLSLSSETATFPFLGECGDVGFFHNTTLHAVCFCTGLLVLCFSGAVILLLSCRQAGGLLMVAWIQLQGETQKVQRCTMILSVVWCKCVLMPGEGWSETDTGQS